MICVCGHSDDIHNKYSGTGEFDACEACSCVEFFEDPDKDELEEE